MTPIFKKSIMLASVFFVGQAALFAQQKTNYTLDQLQAMAKENYPLLKQKDYFTQQGQNKADQLGTYFLPQVTVAGQATYQSEVTQFDMSALGIPAIVISKDQYSLGLELQENIFDYGALKNQKAIVQGNAAIQSQQVEVDYQKVKDQITLLYGNLCMQQESRKILYLRLEELDAKRKKMESAVTNGAALQSNYLVLQADFLTTQQKIEEINSNLSAGYKTLGLLTGSAMDTTNAIVAPTTNIALQTQNIRPEIELFSLQHQNLQLQEDNIFRNNLPKVFAFARGYYGRPGYNFLNNDFRVYGIVGLGLHWSITEYYNSKREHNYLQVNSSVVENQQQLFELNVQTKLVQVDEEIKKLVKLIEMDQEIVSTKTAVRKASSSQLDNGTITSSDYIVDLNAETQAQFNQKLHEIQLMMARQSYNSTLGY